MKKEIPKREKIRAELCRRSLFEFVREFWEVVIPETPVYNWHIPYLCSELEKMVFRVAEREDKEYDCIINIPPGTTKSTIVTVMLPAWAWVVDSRMRIMTASYSGSLSTDHSIKSRDIIRSEKYQKYFPEIEIKRDQDGKTHYKNTKGGERYATSVTGTVTGFHAHILIVDDPLNPKEASSEAQRERANQFMDETLPTRKVDKGVTPTILVMQRLHHADPTGNWLNKKGKELRHICLPGMLSRDVKPEEVRDKYQDGLLDPVRLSKEVLDRMKVDLGSYGFAGQIMQTPTPEGGGIWQKYFKPIKREDVPKDLTMVGTDWDLAYTEKETNSASAYVTAGVQGRKMYILDIGWRWLEFPRLVEWMKTKQFPHYIEAKASGKSAKQVLTNQGIPAIEVSVQGGDKVARATMATPYAEAGMIYVVEDLLNDLYNDSKQGLLLFPKGEHDDLQDAVVQAINRCLAGPRGFVF